MRRNDGSVTRSFAGGGDKAAGRASGGHSLECRQKCWLSDDVGRTAKGDEKNEASRCRCALYEGKNKTCVSESPGFKDVSCLGNLAGGFGRYWLKVVLGMKTMPPQSIFLSLLPGSVREIGRARHKEDEAWARLSRRRRKWMLQRQLKTSLLLSPVSVASQPNETI